MKKLFLGMILGAAITSGIFYYIIGKNESEERENLKSLLASAKDFKTTQQKLEEALNDPNAAMILSSALTVIATDENQFYYYKGNDCSKLNRSDLLNIKDMLDKEKKMAPADELMVIIKKTPGASFRNSIDLLDAIAKAGIAAGNFAEVKLTEKEKYCIQNFKKD